LNRLAVASGVLLASCGDPAGSDWLLAEARSPDARMVARLWCVDYCDVPAKKTLTISVATLDVGVTAAVEGFPPNGTMPAADEALTFVQEERARSSARSAYAGPRVA
jgi:hypothetical protein